MPELSRTLISACALVAFICWASTLFHMFRTVHLRKTGINLWQGWGENPFNLLLEPDKLTDAGLIARRRCFYSVCGFVGVLLLGMAVGMLARL